MAGKSSVIVNFIGDTASLDKSIKHATTMTGKFGASIAGMGAKIGGEFGEIVSVVGDSLERVGEKGTTLGQKMTVAGGAILGFGLLLQQMGSANKQAEDQLKQAIENTGQSFDDFEPSIRKTIAAMQDFGKSDDDTQNALQTLTQATNDPKKAIEQMGLVADLAAAKHVTLAESASMLAKILAGKGARTLTEFGIALKKNKDGTVDVNAALDELSGKLNGQAAAATDNFAGRMGALRTKVTDFAMDLANKVGPAITALGPLVMAAGAIMQTSFAKTFAASNAATLGMVAGWGKVAAKLAIVATIATAAGKAIAGAGDQTVNAGVAAEDLSSKLLDTSKSVDGLGFKLTGLTTGTHDFTDALKTVADPGISNNFENLIGSVAGVPTTLSQATASVQQVDAALADLATGGHLPEATKRFNEFRDAYIASGGSAAEFDRVMSKSADAITGAGAAATRTVGPTGLLGDSIDKVATKALDAKGQLDLYKRTLDKVLGVSLDAKQRELAWADSLDALSESVKTNGKSLNEHTAKGRANTEAILANIKTTQDNAQADLDAGKSLDTVRAKYDTHIAQLRAAAIKAGMNKDAVDALIKKYGQVPAKVSTKLTADATQALSAIRKVALQWANVVGMPTAALNAHFGVTAKPAKHATGGYITGPGTGTSDSVPFWGSAGEYVVTAAAARRLGPGAMSAINSGRLPTGGRSASGGRGGDIHIHVNGIVAGSSLDVARQLKSLLQNAQLHGIGFGVPA